ncbi:MAG: hypothetical protein ACOC2Q_04170, partial [Spirochaetota bacterium]
MKTADGHSESGSLFRSLSVLGLCGHAIILVATGLVGIRPLVIINIVSVSLYATAVVLNRRRWYLVVLAIGLVEVTAHAIVATAILGWSSGPERSRGEEPRARCSRPHRPADRAREPSRGSRSHGVGAGPLDALARYLRDRGRRRRLLQ